MALNKAHQQNLETLIRAAKDGNLCLMECTEIATGEPRAVICAVQPDSTGKIVFVPFGHLCPGNPYEAYEPPT